MIRDEIISQLTTRDPLKNDWPFCCWMSKQFVSLQDIKTFRTTKLIETKIMAKSFSQGRKGKNKPQVAKQNAAADKNVTKKGTKAKQPKGSLLNKSQTPDKKKMSRGDKSKLNKGKSQGKARDKKKSQQKEKPKTKEDLDKEMDDYMMKDEKVASKKLDEDMDSYWEQKKAKDAEEAGKDAEAS
ncbi:hypothetical protein FisN_3Hh506 [Fistulifera solaris]|uniref:Chromatin target of PRMT1 protein C-terminal domain-containing protein n=1 Tax=Fistulifera solaris TaxID=1519565 RepID=A0A1Z5K644_FISSO|nr:hypothetical protein FisN_3Hh506 [Fistulifera solaris]|eukprot:GAX21714.1 hypothetical protein FisN_3Hh506 [Fistulifera solaris]